MKERDSLEQIFQRHAVFEVERPQMRHSTVWWAEKIDHEQDELYEVTSNEPTRKERLAMLDESADVMISLVGFWRSMGVSADLALRVVLGKFEEIEVRYPTTLFDNTNGRTFEENYAEARRLAQNPIDNSSS